jgi:virulence-associated protein VapD
MATKKPVSQAQKTSSNTKKNVDTSKKNTKTAAKATGKQTAKPSVKKAEQEKVHIPVRLISSTVIAAMFVLFLVMFLNPDGALVKFIYNYCILGLFGSIAFYVSIPCLLGLFLLHAFSGKRPVSMRTFCVICFVLICGCMSHQFMNTSEISKGWQMISDLYMGGIQGTTAGVICGSIAMLMRLLLGKVISIIILGVFAVITLLGAWNITIPGIIRAIENRPRAEWEEDDEYENHNLIDRKINVGLGINGEELEVYYPEDDWEKGYDDIKVFMSKHGFELYTEVESTENLREYLFKSRKYLFESQVEEIINKLIEDHPWMHKCAENVNVWETYGEKSLMHLFSAEKKEASDE